jgi:hypothetical protein
VQHLPDYHLDVRVVDLDALQSFSKSEINTCWFDKRVRAKRKHSASLGRLKVAG